VTLIKPAAKEVAVTLIASSVAMAHAALMVNAAIMANAAQPAGQAGRLMKA